MDIGARWRDDSGRFGNSSVDCMLRHARASKLAPGSVRASRLAPGRAPALEWPAGTFFWTEP